MGFISSLFGGSETAKKITETAADGLYNGLDKMFFTDEEKHDAKQKNLDTYHQIMKLAYEENGTRSVTRRYLVWGVSGWVLLAATAAIIAEALGHTELRVSIMQISEAFGIQYAFTAAVGFMFLSGVVHGIKGNPRS